MESLSQGALSKISFAKLPERYQIGKPALSHRVKSLGLKLERRGRNAYLSLSQLSLLDDLDKFLKEESGRTIQEFVNRSMYRQSFDTPLDGHRTIALNDCKTNEKQWFKPTEQSSNVQLSDGESSNLCQTSEYLERRLVEKNNEIKSLKEEINYLRFESNQNLKAAEKLQKDNSQLKAEIETTRESIVLVLDELCYIHNDLDDAIYPFSNDKEAITDIRLVFKRIDKAINIGKRYQLRCMSARSIG